MKVLRELGRKKLLKELLFLALSFIIPFIILIIVLQVNEISLFSYSNRTTIMMDMQSQYIAYMSNFKHILEHHESLVYTTDKVFGGDYMSIYAYYLASPFNIFVVFFDYEALPLFFIWSSLIKMCLASVNMYLLARFTSRFTYTKLIAAIGYGLISYSFIYLSNFMWLDGVMILPLVILGLHFLKDKKHLWLYPLALAYSLMTSWYIGFMICIFTALYFIALFASNFTLKNKANYLFLLRFTLFSLLGGLISAIWWFTAFMHLSGTKGAIAFPSSYSYSINVIISGFLENNYDSSKMITQNNSYFSMFVGVVPLVFAITYFSNKKFSQKERVSFAILLGFYLFASSSSIFYTLLHGGREPTWFPGRYAFIMGFIVSYLASKSLDESSSLHPLYYIAPTVVGIAAIILLKTLNHSARLEYYSLSVPSIIMYFVTILVGVGYSTVCIYNFKNKVLVFAKKYGFVLLASLVVVQVASSYRGADKVLRENMNISQKYGTYLNDIKYIGSFDALKNYEKAHDNSPFYRLETTFNREGTYNDTNNNPMLFNYSGLSNYSSTSKKAVDNYLTKVGFHYNGFFSKYDGGSTFFINSLFGIKYLVEDRSNRNNIHPYFLDKNTFQVINVEDPNNLTYYYNPYATQLSFRSDKTGATFINEGYKDGGYSYWFDKFEYQNEMLHVLDKSINKKAFSPLVIDNIETSLTYEEDIMGIRTYKNVQNGDLITIKFTVPEEAYNYPLYFSEKNYTGDINYTIDGQSYKVNTYWHKGIYSFNDNTSHEHILKIRFNKNYSSVTLRPELYYENVDVTKEYLASASKDVFVIDKLNSSFGKYGYEGHINIGNKVNKDLIFTLPYEKNMKVKVDNINVETYMKYNIFTAIDLSTLEVGEHTVSIYYEDSALRIAAILSGAGVCMIVPLIIFYNRIEKAVFYRKKEEEINN